MLFEQLAEVLSGFKGCTFASLDAETKEGGLIRRVENEQVMLFSNSKSSGYENLVRRRLLEIGKDPSSFVGGDLSWGERIADSPFIHHKGFYYLQTITAKEGAESFWTPTGRNIPNSMAYDMLRKSRNRNQGLPEDKIVRVRCYAVENIKAIRVLGETLPRKILSIKT